MAWASLEQISTVLNLTPRWVNRLVKENGMPRHSRGEYDLVACVHWYIAFLEKRNQETQTGTDLQNEKARLTALQAEKAEDELRRSRGELMRVDELLPTLDMIMGAFKDNMLGRGRKIAPQCAGKTLSQIAQAIEDSDRAMLNNLADALLKLPGRHPGNPAKEKLYASRKGTLQGRPGKLSPGTPG